jgi:hypothetical protein
MPQAFRVELANDELMEEQYQSKTVIPSGVPSKKILIPASVISAMEQSSSPDFARPQRTKRCLHALAVLCAG